MGIINSEKRIDEQIANDLSGSSFFGRRYFPMWFFTVVGLVDHQWLVAKIKQLIFAGFMEHEFYRLNSCIAEVY